MWALICIPSAGYLLLQIFGQVILKYSELRVWIFSSYCVIIFLEKLICSEDLRNEVSMNAQYYLKNYKASDWAKLILNKNI